MSETRDPDDLTTLDRLQPMPDLDQEEYASLKDGVREDGVQDPLHIDENDNIIDGHHRAEIASDLGLDVPVQIHRNLSEEEKVALAWKLNMQERHLEDETKRDLIEDRLKQLDRQGIPNTNKSVANELGVSKSWVAEIRRELADDGEIGTGSDLSTVPQKQKRTRIEQYLQRHPNESNRGAAQALGVHHNTVGSVRDEMRRTEVSWAEEMTGQRVFPYVGSKYNIADWLVSKFPQHETYVEPFGGSAAVLYTKPRSSTEVYNDTDEDLVHFFNTIQESPEGIEQVLQDVEFTREQHKRWTKHWYEGWRPELEPSRSDRPGADARRAAVFLFSRYSQYNNRYRSYAGFYHPDTNPENVVEFEERRSNITEIAERFQDLQVENEDYTRVIDKYDGPDTLFYLDPPYVDKEDYYGEFTHEWLVEIVDDIEGKFILSYGEKLPDGLDHYRRVKLTDIPGDRADVEHHIMGFPEEDEGTFRNALKQDW